MSFEVSTDIRDAMLVAMAAELNGFEINVYANDAAVPASADAAVGSATLLCKYTNNNTGAGCNFEATPVDGVIVKSTSETISGTTLATGTAAFFRIVLITDDGSASTTAPRYQGLCGLTGASMLLDSLTFTTAGGPNIRYLNSLAIGIPENNA